MLKYKMNNLFYLYYLEMNILQTLGPLPIYILIFAIIYFVMIRPQVKQQKNHSDMLLNLKKGDKVITKGGIIGQINDIKGKDSNCIILLDVNGTKIEVLKSFISSIHNK